MSKKKTVLEGFLENASHLTPPQLKDKKKYSLLPENW